MRILPRCGCRRRLVYADSQSGSDSENAFGIISLNAGQTARFNVVNVGNPNEHNARRVRLVFDIYGLSGGRGLCYGWHQISPPKHQVAQEYAFYGGLR